MSVEVEQPDWLLQIEGILESLNEGVLITDECQAIVFANSNLEEMSGRSREEFVGLDIYNVYTKDEADFIVTSSASAIPRRQEPVRICFALQGR